MTATTLTTLKNKKLNGEKFACITAYDSMFSATVERAGIETILVGDSLGMVLQGQDSTLPVTVADMCYHVRSVAAGCSSPLIIGDMPFMSYATIEDGVAAARALMQAGAHCVKLEGGKAFAPLIEVLSSNGVPVCGHLGLTPQSVNKLGGYRVQGREDEAANAILEDAQALEAAGADLLVLECVPTPLAKQITETLTIPTIGIGAGHHTDAQVLVLHDMLGMNPRPAKFVKNFMSETGNIETAIKLYGDQTRSGEFPTAEYAFK